MKNIDCIKKELKDNQESTVSIENIMNIFKTMNAGEFYILAKQDEKLFEWDFIEKQDEKAQRAFLLLFIKKLLNSKGFDVSIEDDKNNHAFIKHID